MSMIGKSLAHYSITSQLGKGGMGEVYQATDTKLGRDVAIKVLPEEFAKDSDRVTRFQREAKLLASLNHPNIAAIYGLEAVDGIHFLVMELIEGDTLADRIKGGPIPVEESLKLALQIAEALEAAHEKGVIHRDLKPANIKVTPEGKVKVLDFGLAKAFAQNQSDLNLSNSPTLSIAATQQGVILGTAAYMSPEQARGKEVDRRADIWAFGVVFFEMLTGFQLFSEDTVSDTLASVLKTEPDWQSLPPNLHPRICLLLERCLNKEVRNRYGSISDARVDIQEILTNPNRMFPQAAGTVEPHGKPRSALLWIVAAIVLTSIITGVAAWNLRKPKPPEVTRFEYELPGDLQFSSNVMPLFAVSPDGRQFVFSTSKGLYLKSADKFTGKIIPFTDTNPLNPFFSHDGKWIAYMSSRDSKLKKVAINGGAPVILCDTPLVAGASWGADGTIFYGAMTDGIMSVSDQGGDPAKLAGTEDETCFHPRLLPDGKSLIFTVETNEGYKTVLQSIQSGKRKVLVKGDDAWYLLTGHILYAVNRDLFAVPFDLDRLEVTGDPFTVLEGIHRASNTAPHFAVSDSGTLLYLPEWAAADTIARRTLLWVDEKGKETPISVEPDSYMFPRISPDGVRVAFGVTNGVNSSLWIWDESRQTRSRMTLDNSIDLSPLWTGDGKKIVFYSVRGGKPGIYLKAADGSGEAEPLDSVTNRIGLPMSWSVDEKMMMLWEFTGAVRAVSDTSNLEGWLATPGVSLTSYISMDSNIGMLPMEEDQARKPLLQKFFDVGNPQISPDGHWMAYISNETDQYEVYVCSFPRVEGKKLQVSTGGGMQARWSPDGRQLFYSSQDAMMVVPIQTEPALKAGNPRVIFQGGNYQYGGGMWDLSPDGKHFLMMKETAEAAAEAPRRIRIVLNWFEELKERVPTD
jgi:serine/threonine protein kinase